MRVTGKETGRAPWLMVCLGVLLSLFLLRVENARGQVADPPLPRPGPADDALGLPRAPAWHGFEVLFIGNSVIDLRWDYYGMGGDYRRIERRTSAEPGWTVLTTIHDTATWRHRDDTVTKGVQYTYRLCYGTTGQEHNEECTPEYDQRSPIAGNVTGTLYEDLTWADGTYGHASSGYVLGGSVSVASGATLEIGTGATVKGLEISDASGGELRIDHATLTAILELTNEASYVTDSTLGTLDYRPQWTILTLKRDGETTGNTFVKSGLQIGYQCATAVNVTVTDNDFTDFAGVEVYEATARIHDNRFQESSIIVYDGATATIEDNDFTDIDAASHMVIHLQSSVSTTFRGNHVRGTDAGRFSFLRVVGPATIEGNRFEGPGSEATERNAIELLSGPTDTIAIRDNIFLDWYRAVRLPWNGAVELRGNTIMGNWEGVFVWGDGPHVIEQNCIAANDRYGLVVDSRRTVSLTAESNYWGDPTGPFHHLDHPEGQGDVVYGPAGIVDFTPWLTPSNCAPDLGFAGLEVVQSVQDFQNSVPLVAGKRTIVRVYPESNGATLGVTAILTGSRGGVELEPVLVATGDAGPITDLGRVRDDDRGGLRFTLPDEWLTGTLDFELQLSPDQPIEEVTDRNNVATHAATFVERGPLHIGFVPIDPDFPSLVEVSRVAEMAEYLRDMYPLSEVTSTLMTTMVVAIDMKAGGEAREAARGKRIILPELHDLLVEYNRGNPGNPLDQIYGIFPGRGKEYITLGRADAMWGGGAGSGRASYGLARPEHLAHEIGHNLGLQHPCTWAERAECLGAWDNDTDWPSYYPDASVQEPGYWRQLDLVTPRDLGDVMTYFPLPLAWISPHHYVKLFNANGRPQSSVSPASANVPLVQQTYLLASGVVYTDGTVSFNPFWQMTTTNPPDNPPVGTGYCLELRDAGETVLDGRCFDLAFVDSATHLDLDLDAFFVALPLATGTARVVLRQGSTELGDVRASDHPPTVTLLAPNGGESLGGSATVVWTGSDVDGDALSYRLRYSSDGGASWVPVALGITGTSPITYELGLLLVAGGTNARLEVEASDGFHTASDASDGPFTVADNPPLVDIFRPEAVATVAPVALRGYALDIEDGELVGDALAWTSDLDGPLGTGGVLPSVELSGGQHVVTLTATDSEGHASRDSVTIGIFMEDQGIAGLSAANDGPTTVGDATTLTATVTAGTDVDFTWTFADGAIETGPVAVHAYATVGAYTATVTATNPVNTVSAATMVTVELDTTDIYLPMVLRMP